MLKAELEREVKRLTEERNAAQKALDQLEDKHLEHLERIGKKAMELAVEHDWCGVVSEALEELGVPTSDRVKMKLVLNVTGFTTGRAGSDLNRWVVNSLDMDLEELSEKLFDSDWSGVVINDVEVEIQ